jgi:tricarballylate dehydrogenase
MSWDVIVVGGGNAGFCAAHAARQAGASVLLLEKAPAEWAGGNSYFTAGAIRTTFAGLDDLVPLLWEPDERQLQRTDIPPYAVDDFIADMRRVTLGHCDPDLTATLAHEIAPTVAWMRDVGLRFRLMYDRQSFEVDGRHRFWGGLALGTVDGGEGMIKQYVVAAEAAGIEIRYEAPVDALLREDAAVVGVVSRGTPLSAGAVVLAAGGFEANPRLRAQYLGPNWDLAKVRGTPHNTGEVLMAALDAGARATGHWSGCHSVAWDAQAPQVGSRKLTHRLTKQSYPIGLVVNAAGDRFLDEGADMRNYTYAKYGAEILRQPGALAFQLFDARTAPLLRRDEYEAPGVSRSEAGSIRELAEVAGIDRDRLEATIAAYNSSLSGGHFNPAVKDGLSTNGLTPPKSNWAQPLDTPPFLAFAVTCGVTFTFGGLEIDSNASVRAQHGGAVRGLFAAGELTGGLFFHNYPGGSGLAAGAVFGRRAGYGAARHALARRVGGSV